jgi:hypothetical protein
MICALTRWSQVRRSRWVIVPHPHARAARLCDPGMPSYLVIVADLT